MQTVRSMTACTIACVVIQLEFHYAVSYSVLRFVSDCFYTYSFITWTIGRCHKTISNERTSSDARKVECRPLNVNSHATTRPGRQQPTSGACVQDYGAKGAAFGNPHIASVPCDDVTDVYIPHVSLAACWRSL